jgi:uncharacterized protein
MKVLLWLLVGFCVAMWLLRGKKRAHAPAASHGAGAPGEPMRQCDYCGLHIPASEALPAPGDKAYCCEEHRRKA